MLSFCAYQSNTLPLLINPLHKKLQVLTLATGVLGEKCIFVQGWQPSQPTQSQLIQIYSVDWTDVYDTHNIEHRTEPVSH